MSRIEIGIIFIICALPIIALALILPKKLFSKKNGKTKTEQAKIVEKPAPIKEEPKQEEVKAETKPKQKEEKQNEDITDLYQEDDFKAYLKDRAEKHPAPKAKDGDLSSSGRFDPDLFRPVGITPPPKPKTNKTMAEEIEELSPELKALLLSGALQPKYFDNDKDK